MALTEIKKRVLKNVGDDVQAAVVLMENKFGGRLTHDSNHDRKSGEKAPTWIFTFKNHGDAQIALRMNKQKLSLLMRSRTVSGRLLEEVAAGLGEVEETYTRSDKGVSSSILGPHAPFLRPSPSNPLLRFNPAPCHVEAVLSLYLLDEKRHIAGTSLSAEGGSSKPSDLDPEKGSRPLSAGELQEQLNRKSEIGLNGELFALLDEIERLRGLGCPDPEKWVERISDVDVGRGFDIDSSWPGQERCIEVKTTTQEGNDFYLTDNEQRVLALLGDKAWLYRVVLNPDAGHRVVLRLQNPLRWLAKEALKPMVFRVEAAALEQAATAHAGSLVPVKL